MREPHYCPTPQPHMSSPGKGKAWGVVGAGGISSGVQAPRGRELQGGGLRHSIQKDPSAPGPRPYPQSYHLHQPKATCGQMGLKAGPGQPWKRGMEGKSLIPP